MKTKLLLGALMVSAMLCGRSQGADLIGRMVSLDDGCAACAKPACEPACEQPACDVCGPRHRCDLFAGLKDLFASRRCVPACDAPACEPVCGPTCHPQPVRALLRKIASVGECNACGPAACEPACEKPACEPACEQPACEPACGPTCRPQPIRNVLRKIAALGECNACGPAACEPACEEPACEPACEPTCRSCDRPVLNFLKNVFGPRPQCGACAPVSDCGCGVNSAPAAAPSNGAAPLPAAPTPDA